MIYYNKKLSKTQTTDGKCFLSFLCNYFTNRVINLSNYLFTENFCRTFDKRKITTYNVTQNKRFSVGTKTDFFVLPTGKKECRLNDRAW